MRLTKWQRIGIVISIVWALSAGIYQRNIDIQRAEHFVDLAYRACTEAKYLHHDYDFESCSRESEKNWAIWLEGSWGNVAYISLVPIPFGWIAAYLTIKIFRWVKAEFKRERLERHPPP
jgi:hypothetical protein